MIVVMIDEAVTRLQELFDAAIRGEEVIVVANSKQGRQGVTLVPADEETFANRPLFGSARGKLRVPDDFDDPISDFKEYP